MIHIRPDKIRALGSSQFFLEISDIGVYLIKRMFESHHSASLEISLDIGSPRAGASSILARSSTRLARGGRSQPLLGTQIRLVHPRVQGSQSGPHNRVHFGHPAHAHIAAHQRLGYAMYLLVAPGLEQRYLKKHKIR